MTIAPDREHHFGQSVIRRNKDVIIKTFFYPEDYYKEKYFLSLLRQEGINFIPRIISADDQKYEIITPYYGESLDDIDWRLRKLNWFCRIASFMEKVWLIKTAIDSRYRKLGPVAFQFVENYLSASYQTQMARAGIEQEVIRRSIGWLGKVMHSCLKQPSIPALIHFDISPRNVLVNKNSFCVIDWSRAMYSELSIEIAIMREKFEMIDQPLTCISRAIRSKLNLNFIDNLAKCFSIYRKAKKIGTAISQADYLRFVETTISSS